ncbi:MAG: nucleotidyl transferase AbiEii/AbiGii toxin family protein [Mollicutes bacterium]|nr:nucleotidyl transferase AbiEii/AbiGii toxin family protein [Mollicutes bacterium]
MIDLMACLEDKHVNYVVGKDENKKDIYEKFVHSLKLLEQLDSLLANKHYVFKGGTSLLLLFESASRFSIDIDICMEESEFENKDALELFFKENIKPPFIDVTRDKDRNSHGGRDIKATHYRFFYNPKYKSKENFVLLDVTFQNNSINGNKHPITHPSVIQVGEPFSVKAIDIDDLLGDKLTAFAPNTIGVKYTAKNQFGRPKSTEIIKQLYDCAYLANHYSDLDRVTYIYKELGNLQIKYEKNKGLDLRCCLKDTIRTCELLLSGGYGDKNSYKLLTDGIRNFNDYKINGSVSIVDVQASAMIVDIIASKILKKLYPLIKIESKLDYLIRTGIKEKEIKLIASKSQLDEFFTNCLLSL